MAIDEQLQPASSYYITYEEYLLHEGENPHTVWVDGQLVDISLITNEECQLRLFVLVALHIWVDERYLGVVHAAPFNMKTGANLPGRAPEVYNDPKDSDSGLRWWLCHNQHRRTHYVYNP